MRLIGRRFQTVFLIVVGFVFLTSCSKRKHDNSVDPEYDGVQYTVQGGVVQKGPFYASGSSVTIHEWNDSFTPIENIYSSTIASNLGRYSLTGKINSRYCDISAQGYYYNEVSGAKTDQTLSLSTIADVSTDDTINVNVLTTLAKNRIRNLCINGKKTFSEAREQAKSEVLAVFNITDSDVMNLNEMDLCLDGKSHDILLAVSAMCQGILSVSGVSTLLYEIADDLEEDGSVEAATFGKIRDNARDISLLAVEENIEDYLGNLGVTVSKEGFRNYVEAVYEDIPPTCEVEAPGGDTTMSRLNDCAFCVKAEDVDGSIRKVQFYVDNVLSSADVSSPYAYTWNMANVSPGSHSLKAVVMDDDGKNDSTSININIINLAPTCTITYPPDNAILTKGSDVNVTVAATDSDGTVTNVKFFVDESLLVSDSQSPYSFTWNTLNYSSEKHTLKAVAVDNEGAETECEVVVELNNIPPTCTITSPENEDVMTRGECIVEAEASDSDGNIVSVHFYIDDVLVSTDAASPYSYTWNTSSAFLGDHTIKAVAVDNSGAETAHEIVVVLTNHPPTCSITSPADQAIITRGPNRNILVSANDIDGTVALVQFFIDGILVSTDNKSSYLYAWGTSDAMLGEHVIKAVSIDNNGAETADSITVVLTNSLPTCTITTPGDNDVLEKGSECTINVTATDADGTVSTVYFYIDGIQIGVDDSSPFSQVWDTEEASTGIHTIRALAVDNDGGEQAQEITVEIAPDNYPPNCTITSPSPGVSIIQGTDCVIEAEASDDDGTVASVQFYIDDVRVNTDYSSPYSYTWSTTSVSVGSHKIKTLATDNLGLTGSDSISIQIDTSNVAGVWYAEYTGYDPQSQSDVTIRRKLIVETLNSVYKDSLWGEPSGGTEILFETEEGTWETDPGTDIITWKPTVSKRIDLSSGTLETYSRGNHTDDIDIDEDEWTFTDTNMNVTYQMKKQK